MSSFIEDGASEISAFASIRWTTPSAGFRPTRTHSSGHPWAFSIMILRQPCSCLRGRWRFDGPREVGLALFQEDRERLFGVFRADLRTELFILGLHRGLDLLTKWLLHEPLAGLQCPRRLRSQFLSRFGRSRQHVLVGQDLGNQTQLSGTPGVEGNRPQDKLRRQEMT